MKTIFNKQKKSVVGAVIAMLAFTSVVTTGCQKDFELDLPLAVSSRELSLTKDAGSTHVLVYSNGEWTARFTRNVKWASLNKQQGYGNHEIIFTYAANYGVSRKIGVVLQKGDLADTVMFTQAGAISEPSLAFNKSTVSLLKAPSPVFAPISTNLRYCIDDLEATVTYYDENGLANEPVPVVTRAEGDETEGEGTGEGEEGGEEEGPQAIPVDPWISNVSISYEGVSFEVLENATGFPRQADLTIFITDAQDVVTRATLSILQGIADPVFSLDSESGTYEGYAQSCVVPATSNNLVPYADQFVYEIAYDVPVEEGAEWILNPTITDEGLQFVLAMNEGDANRTATINLSYTDGLGNAVASHFSVTQKPYPAAADFATIRALTPGEINLQQYIEGYVVSDPTSKNIISSPQTGQFAFDRTLNDKTAYIESTDGRYGFCLQFATEEDNTLERFSKVKIAVAGLTLEKNVDPEYYTLTGLTAANILETAAADEFKVPTKTKNIAELTDDDIFTLVSIPNLEILQKDGAYTNCTDGYSLKDDINPIGATAPRWDVAPLKMYDRDGNTINMLTNAAVPWRRYSSGHDLEFYSVVPQGSGTFRGIVVADDVINVRYGNVGRYQLRAMTEEEIDLNDEPFAKTIVEWNWNDRTVDLVPEIGSGEINRYNATQAGASDFNNVVCSGTAGAAKDQKGLVPNGGIRFDNTWWDFNNNVGKYFDISFSTAGISGNTMLFGIVWGAGDMGGTNIKAPSNWNLLYSVDGGESFQAVPNCDPIKLRCIVWWTTTPVDCAPGFTEHVRMLPADCFGKDKVVLRLQAASTVTNLDPKSDSSNYQTALCVEKGTITESDPESDPEKAKEQQQVRIGTITVRYN